MKLLFLSFQGLFIIGWMCWAVWLAFNHQYQMAAIAFSISYAGSSRRWVGDEFDGDN